MKNKTTLLLTGLLSIIIYKSDARKNEHSMQKEIMITDSVKQTLSTKERVFAIKSLKETELSVFDNVKGLSEAQLTYKPAADKWSVEECVKHIASAEKALWAMVEESLNQPANPEKRAGIKFTDKELIAAVEDRTHKSKTFAALEPANAPYKSTEEALASFKENREKLIAFIKNTDKDLRNHVSVLSLGTYDAYQFILLISAHSNRHTQQIEEVKDNADFPKK